MADRILVLIPCYNCENQIGRVLEQFTDPAMRDRFETLLVLDNQSRDGTIAAAQRAALKLNLKDVLVGRNQENYGLGGSHKAGFAYADAAGYTHVVVLHGDDQGHIRDLVPTLDQGLHRSHDACLGSRFMRRSKLHGYSPFRIFGNYTFNLLFSVGSLSVVSDLGSGLNIFSKSIFSDPRVLRYSDDLRFNVYLLLDAIDQKRRLTFFPISWREDDQVSNVKMASQAAKTIEILYEYLFRRAFFRTGEHRQVARAEYRFDIIENQLDGAKA